MRTYYVYRIGDIAFEGHTNKKFQYGRFVENTLANGIVSHIFDIYRPIQKEHDLWFWKYYIHNENIMRDVLRKSTTKATMMTNLVNKDLLKQKLNIPILEEQKKIGRLFSQIDRTITLHEEQHRQLEQLKKALLQKMFADETGYPVLRFKGFTEKWEQRKLGEIADVYDGVHQTPDYQDSGVMFLSVENIKTLKSNKYISEKTFEKNFKIFPEQGDILMTRIGDIGTTNIVQTSKRLGYYVSLALLKPKNIASHFLNSVIATPSFQISLKRRSLLTATPQKINKDEIGKVYFFISQNLQEQEKIGQLFQSLDKTITLHDKKIQYLKQLKRGLLQKMFV
ncbi:restriction endonuclease subunit S [Limosilactobacillus mucosae]|uniref:restriction endonuclease subunit S n=1 Tax=Limosilactobacillus mucosae TaxID=97478 RepID=UPI003B9A4CA1